MAFIPENELERALVQAAHNPAAAHAFYHLLLESDLFVLGSVAGHEDEGAQFALSPGGQISLVTGEKNGVRYLPVFSSLTRMQDYLTPETKYLRVNGRALLDLVRGGPVTLNPASEYGKELTPDQVQQLLDGPRITPQFVQGKSKPPAELMDAMRKFFAARPDIQTAWMIMTAPAERLDDALPLLGIETSGDWPSLLQALQAVAAAAPVVTFDVQRVDRLNPVGVAAALMQVEPFYQRRSLN